MCIVLCRSYDQEVENNFVTKTMWIKKKTCPLKGGVVYLVVLMSVVANDYFRAYVTPHVTTKLWEIGTALALTPPELDDIEENHQGIYHWLFQLSNVKDNLLYYSW